MPNDASPGRARPVSGRPPHSGSMGAVGLPTVRFRRSSAVTVAAVIAMIAGLSLATWAPAYWLVLLVIPLAVAVWSWRSGTDVNRDGLTVKAALGRRRIP